MAGILNFVVTGQIRCGASVIQTSVNSHHKAVCHADLLHPESKLRKELHESYFGEQVVGDIPDWCSPLLISPEQYMTTRIFDNPKFGEQAVGLKVLYPEMRLYELWDYFEDWGRVGDFCLIHITRNPLACYVSMKQAEKSGVWHCDVNRGTAVVPPPVYIEVEELTWFCRWHVAAQNKIRTLFKDRLEITYKELFLNYKHVMSEVFKFLELPAYPDVAPSVRRLKNRGIRDRVMNYTEARLDSPSEIRPFFDAPDLF